MDTVDGTARPREELSPSLEGLGFGLTALKEERYGHANDTRLP